MKGFVSYSSADNALAEKIVNFLRDQPMSVWFDRIEIRPGDSLLAKIASGIDSADFLIALVSTTSVTSAWVEKELGIALTKEMRDKKPIVVPLIIEPCDVPTMLADKVYIRVSKSQTNFADIIPALFRDSYVLDIDLNTDLTVNRTLLKTALYNFSRSHYTSARVRLNNHDFDDKVDEITKLTLDDSAITGTSHGPFIVSQIRDRMDTYNFVAPLFWGTLAEFLSRLVDAIFAHFDKTIDAIQIATSAISNTMTLTMYDLAKYLGAAVFSSYAEKAAHPEIATWIAQVSSETDDRRSRVEKIANLDEVRSLVEVGVEGVPPETMIGTRFYASIYDREYLQFASSGPSTEIMAEPWYRLCVPQIIARELIRAVFREGRPLHELPYTIGLNREDYGRMGPT